MRWVIGDRAASWPSPVGKPSARRPVLGLVAVLMGARPEYALGLGAASLGLLWSARVSRSGVLVSVYGQAQDLFEPVRERLRHHHGRLRRRGSDYLLYRLLTIIATLFIPLTFVAGVYGMNFGNNTHGAWAMPELRWDYGYPMVWGVMIAIAAGMLYVFKRKK